MTPEQFQKLTNVSRETLEQLKLYESLLRKWSATINLIGKSTQDDIWSRHFLESYDFLKYIGENDKCIDFGTGAGFPGLVLTLLRNDPIELIESDERKCQFLFHLGRQLKVNVKIYKKRIEEHTETNYDRVISRACAPLTKLCGFTEQLMKDIGKAVFIKGANINSEIEEAQLSWNFDYKIHPRQYNEQSKFIVMWNIKKKK
jgi:16S rRNA (guanine527-N7)-methyltransferase